MAPAPRMRPNFANMQKAATPGPVHPKCGGTETRKAFSAKNVGKWYCRKCHEAFVP